MEPADHITHPARGAQGPVHSRRHGRGQGPVKRSREGPGEDRSVEQPQGECKPSVDQGFPQITQYWRNPIIELIMLLIEPQIASPGADHLAQAREPSPRSCCTQQAACSAGHGAGGPCLPDLPHSQEEKWRDALLSWNRRSAVGRGRCRPAAVGCNFCRSGGSGEVGQKNDPDAGMTLEAGRSLIRTSQ